MQMSEMIEDRNAIPGVLKPDYRGNYKALTTELA